MSAPAPATQELTTPEAPESPKLVNPFSAIPAGDLKFTSPEHEKDKDLRIWKEKITFALVAAAVSIIFLGAIAVMFLGSANQIQFAERTFTLLVGGIIGYFVRK